jgi:hypothetical protein
MNGWSISTHDDLPPLPGRRSSSPLAHRLPGGQVPSAPPISPIDSERIARQGAIARTIRQVLPDLPSRRRQRMLADRALLIEVADSADEVLELLDEVEQLGVKVGRKS